MKNRNLWFISFYLLLAIFIIHQLVYLFFLSKNQDLKNLYTNGFDIVVPTNSFNYSSYGAVFYLPIVGLTISCTGFIGCILSSKIFINKSSGFKLAFLIGTFSVFTIGFLINFAGELFYSEWNNKIAIIHPRNAASDVTFTANYFYQNWLSSSRLVWTIFGLYFSLLVLCIIFLIKLNLINIEFFKYQRQHKKEEEHFEPELLQRMSTSNEFDPNETQTITIFFDHENNKTIDLEEEYDEYEEDTKSDSKKNKWKKQK